MAPGCECRRFPRQLHGQDCKPEKPGQNNNEGDQHFESGTNDGRHFCGAKILGGENALHDKEIGGPVAERQDRAETEYDAGPMDAHGIVFEITQGGPEMRVFRGSIARNLQPQIAPAASFNQTQNRDQQRSRPNQNELQHFVEDR